MERTIKGIHINFFRNEKRVDLHLGDMHVLLLKLLPHCSYNAEAERDVEMFKPQNLVYIMPYHSNAPPPCHFPDFSTLCHTSANPSKTMLGKLYGCAV